MRKKKVLVHGTLESLQKFFSDAVSHDYEIVAILSKKKFSIQGFEIFTPRDVPRFVYKLVDAVIFTSVTTLDELKIFTKRGLELQKIILWDSNEGWKLFCYRDADGTEVILFCGLELHLRDEEDKIFFNDTYNRLQNQRLFKNLNPQVYPNVLAEDFKRRTGHTLDFNNLRTFTEKLQWLKIFDSTPLKSRLADKYLVRNWVSEKIGEQYLIPLLGVWDNFDDIDFDELPDQFVLKCNHGSGMNIIVRDKKSFDVTRAREKINAWLATDFASLFLELHYTNIKRKIIVEKFMPADNESDIPDYKFWCFDGHVEYIQVDRNRSTNHVQRFYSVNWEPLSFNICGHTIDKKISEKPSSLETMLNIAKKLSAGFNFVRVDLYLIEGKIYFGEMTFTPLCGYFKWNPEDIDYYLGSLIRLNSDK